MENLKSKTVRGVSWTGLQTLITQVLGVVSGIVLARLLSPEDFGLVGMVVVFTGFASMFSHFGFHTALIQKKEITEAHISSVFWVNLITSIVIAGLFLLFAPLIAKFYNEPALVIIIQVYVINFILVDLSTIHNTLFEKELNFKTIAIANIIAFVLSSIIAILMAMYGFGFWAIVANTLLINFFIAAYYWLKTTWWPKFIISKSAIKELLGFGLNMTGIGILQYVTKQIDSLLIGKFLGAGTLGIYNKAYTFLMYPIAKIKYQIIKVIFPAFSKIQDDLGKMKSGTIGIISILILILFPLMLGLYLVAEEFVLLILGNAWIDMIPILQIFCIASLFEIPQLSGIIFMAIGKDKVLIKIVFFMQAISVLCIIIGLQWGLVGVAYAVCIATMFRFILDCFCFYWSINLKPSTILKDSSLILLANLIMFSALFFIDKYYLFTLELSYRFMIKVILGGVIYISSLLIFKPKAFVEILTLINKNRTKKILPNY